MSNRSLRDYEADDQDNIIPMMLDKHRLVLIVEGCTDEQFYRPLIRGVHIESAGNKNSVRTMLHTIDDDKRRYRCRALVDRDYDFFTNRKSKNDLVIYTDANSLETMVWMTDENYILSIIIAGLVHKDTYYEVPFAEIYDNAYQAAYLLGLIRLANSVHGWNLSFKNFIFQDNMFDEQGRLLLEPVVDMLLTDEKERICTREKLTSEIQKLERQKLNPWQIRQGHDLSAAFVYHIKKNCTFYPEDRKDWNDYEDAVKNFEKQARSTANIGRLRETECFKVIHQWISENAN